jgi:cytoskeletal protein CcmA (bactofilin family)
MAIFGKTDGPAALPSPAEHPASSGAPAQSVVGAKARFVGELAGDEDVAVHGRFEGTIDVSRKVVVAQGGEMKGDIHARSVVVGGRVQGQVRADERAELLASASVQGDVRAPKVVIAEGAQLQGSVAMSSTASARGAAPERSEEK